MAVAVLLGGYLLLTSTVTLHDSLWAFDVKRILQLCLLPLALLATLSLAALRSAFGLQLRRIPRPTAIALGLVFALGLLSAGYNASPGRALAYSLADVLLLFLLGAAALAVAACRAVAGPGFDRAAMLLLALVGIAVGLQELLGVAAAWASGLEFNPGVALLHFSWPRFYNQVQSWSLPVLAALPLVFRGRPLARLLCLLALALHWYVLLASGGRGSLISVALATAVAALLLPGARRALLGWQLAGLAAGVLIYALVLAGHARFVPAPAAAVTAGPPAAPASFEEHTAAPAAQGLSSRFLEPLARGGKWTSSGRTELWRDAWRDGLEHPLLGIGPMNYACQGPVYRAAHPHSFALQLFAEWGLPALLLVLLAAAATARRGFIWLRAAEGEEGVLGTALATGVVAAALLSGLDGVLLMPESQMTGVLVCGWLLGLAPAPARRAAGTAGAGALLAALGLALLLLVFAREELRVSALRLEQTPLMDRLIPRFWQNGKVCQLYLAGRPGPE